ncbi:MAG TPA: hypothetical protein VGW38_06060 [Chloroflexota bacterium]|nr:hypothetical protein [Chloroflexota bacterium]
MNVSRHVIAATAIMLIVGCAGSRPAVGPDDGGLPSATTPQPPSPTETTAVDDSKDEASQPKPLQTVAPEQTGPLDYPFAATAEIVSALEERGMHCDSPPDGPRTDDVQCVLDAGNGLLQWFSVESFSYVDNFGVPRATISSTLDPTRQDVQEGKTTFDAQSRQRALDYISAAIDTGGMAPARDWLLDTAQQMLEREATTRERKRIRGVMYVVMVAPDSGILLEAGPPGCFDPQTGFTPGAC